DADPADTSRWEGEASKLQTTLANSVYDKKVQSQQSILEKVAQNKCCDVHLIGHGGSSETHGGIVTYSDNNDKIVILPDFLFEVKLGALLKANCPSPSIHIYACSGFEVDPEQTRRSIAGHTKAAVYGALPQGKDLFITIGRCPNQSWVSLDPNATADETQI